MGKKLPELTLDEHREVANILAKLRCTLLNADVLHEFGRRSETVSRLTRAAKDVDKLRSKLEGLLFEQLPPDVVEPTIYNPSSVDPLPWDRVSHELHAAMRVINGYVPARIIDLYLRCDRSTYRALFRLDEELNDGNGEFLRGFAPYSHEDDCSRYYSSGGCTCGASERERSDRAAERVRRDRRKGASLEVPGA